MSLKYSEPAHPSWFEWFGIVRGIDPIRAPPLVGQSELTLVVIGIVGFLVVVGIGVTVVRRGKQDGNIESTTTVTSDTKTEAASKSLDSHAADLSPSGSGNDTGEISKPLGDQTLDRLESVVPAAVSRARDQSSIDWETSDLRYELEDAITAGRLDPTVNSSFGEEYEVVNLPSRYREVTLPVSGETIHISNVGAVARETVSNDPPRDVARTISAIDDHCQQINSYINKQESEFVEAYSSVNTTLDDIRQLTDRFEGSFGSRLVEFLIEGRHEDLSSVVEVERCLADAQRILHRASFDDAMRQLENSAQTADELLMAVEFFGGLIGTIDHGGGTVPVPDCVPKTMLAELIPLVEQQYGSTLELTDQKLVVTATPTSSDNTLDSSESFEHTDNSEQSNDGYGQSPRESVRLDAVADEVLFLFRELETNTSQDTVECQTEQLPTAISRPEILAAIVSFCNRQPDIVDSVELQKNAPPGFLEINFTNRVNAKTGLETLHERYASQHGRSS